MKMKLRLELPDVKIYLVLLLVIGEIVYAWEMPQKAIKTDLRSSFYSDSKVKWRRYAGVLLGRELRPTLL